jgi:hypothetical protein
VTPAPLPHQSDQERQQDTRTQEFRTVDIIVFVGLSLGLAGLMTKACQVAASARFPGRED